MNSLNELTLEDSGTKLILITERALRNIYKEERRQRSQSPVCIRCQDKYRQNGELMGPTA